MNVHTNSIVDLTAPEPGWKPADDVNRAKSILLTVWIALSSPDFDQCIGDTGAVADTLYEAYQRLQRAEKNLGVYQ